MWVYQDNFFTVDRVIYDHHCKVRVNVDEPINLSPRYPGWDAEVADCQIRSIRVHDAVNIG